jgi:hypothetical protein
MIGCRLLWPEVVNFEVSGFVRQDLAQITLTSLHHVAAELYSIDEALTVLAGCFNLEINMPFPVSCSLHS